jgi:hypothetical protein
MSLADYALLDVADVKGGLGYQQLSAASDPRIEALINAASLAIEQATNRRLRWRQYTNELVLGLDWATIRTGRRQDAMTRLTLEWPLTARPTITVANTLLTVWWPGDPEDPQTKDVVAIRSRNPAFGIWTLHRWSKWDPSQTTLATYEAGYGGDDTDPVVEGSARHTAPIPTDLKEATLIVVRELYKLPDRQGILSVSVEGQSTSFAQVAIPIQAKQLLAPYTRFVIGAV